MTLNIELLTLVFGGVMGLSGCAIVGWVKRVKRMNELLLKGIPTLSVSNLVNIPPSLLPMAVHVVGRIREVFPSGLSLLPSSFLSLLSSSRLVTKL